MEVMVWQSLTISDGFSTGSNTVKVPAETNTDNQ